MGYTIVAQDSFTDVDGTNLNSHTPGIGIAWTGTNPQIYSSKARSAAFAALTGWQEINDNGDNSYVQFELQPAYSGWIATLFLRGSRLNPNGSIRAQFSSGSSNQLKIYVNSTSITEQVTHAFVAGDVVKLSVEGPSSGATIKVLKNGATIWLGTYAVPSSGVAGFSVAGIGGNYNYIDAFEYGVESLNTPFNLTATCTSPFDPSLPTVPVADFSWLPITGNAPLEIDFTDESTGVPTAWLWEINGSEYTTQNCSHTFTNAGMYTVRLTVTNNLGYGWIEKSVIVSNTIEPPPDSGVIGFGIEVSNGNYLFIDTFNDRVLIYDSSFAYQGFFGSHGTGDGQFDTATYLVEDCNENVYVVDSGNNRVQVFSLAGAYLWQFGNDDLDSPYGIATNCVYLYVTDRGSKSVVVFNLDGTKRESFSTDWDEPWGIAIDRDYIYVISNNASRLCMYTLTGELVLKHYDTFSGPTWAKIIDSILWLRDEGNDRLIYYNILNMFQIIYMIDKSLSIKNDIHGVE